jgi:hypothetical protein
LPDISYDQFFHGSPQNSDFIHSYTNIYYPQSSSFLT